MAPKFEKWPKSGRLKVHKKWFLRPRNQNLTPKMGYLLLFDLRIMSSKFLKNPQFSSFWPKTDMCRFQNYARGPPIMNPTRIVSYFSIRQRRVRVPSGVQLKRLDTALQQIQLTSDIQCVAVGFSPSTTTSRICGVYHLPS